MQQDGGRRAQIRRVKRYLTDSLNDLFAGKKPSMDQAREALQERLRFYPMPPGIRVRINRVNPGPPPTLVMDILRDK